mmetsp:Transcript_41982/g.57273  ORF Transcript_41982/g.57273 Transcript_41982/m.57273 type:complete len:82 (-) Transcript_41982:291-536(-)
MRGHIIFLLTSHVHQDTTNLASGRIKENVINIRHKMESMSEIKENDPRAIGSQILVFLDMKSPLRDQGNKLDSSPFVLLLP